MDEYWSLRRESGGKIAGVCGALATRWQVDPLVVRIAAVLLGLSAGVGVVLYAFAWALLPAEDAPESPVQRHTPRLAAQSREFWVVTTIVTSVVVAASLGQFAPLGLTPALVVLAVWYFGFRRPQQQARRRDQAAPRPGHLARHDPFGGAETPFTAAAREWQQTVLQHRSVAAGAAGRASSGPSVGPDRTTPGPRPQDPDPARPEPDGAPGGAPVPAPRAEALSGHTAAVRSYLNVPDPAGLYAPSNRQPAAGPSQRSNRGTAVLLLVTTLVVLAGLATLDVLSPLPIAVATYLGTALLVSAVMLVVAAFRGRFRGQLLIAGVLLAATAVTATPQPVLSSTGWEQPALRYSTLAELPASNSIDVGTLRVDLSGLAVTENDSYRVSADAGRIELVLPPDTRVDLQAAVDVGSITVDGERLGGVDLTQRHELGPASGEVLAIEARVDAGTLVVTTS